MSNPRRNNRGIEENSMAILDASGVKDARDIQDDRFSFLEAVRASTIISERGIAPTSKMFEAIFQILKDDTSLELMMASYQLLLELDKHYPRVHLAHPAVELVVVQEAWSPFVFGSENARCEGGKSGDSCDPIDSNRFFLLTQDIAQAVGEMDSRLLEKKTLGDMLLFQYLVSVLEGDFSPRFTAYKETMNWALLRESLLHLLLGSRRINFKSLVKDCFSIISNRSHGHAEFSPHSSKNGQNSSAKVANDCDVALAIAVTELEKEMYIAMEKFMVLIMELDVMKKEAEMKGYTSRADGVRTPLVDIILDELTYDKDILSPFLQAFSEPKWKLEIILQYFSKYVAKPSVRTRRSESDNSLGDATFESVLKCFSNTTSTKNIVRKMSVEVAQVLLSHAFKAYLSLQYSPKETTDSDMNIESSYLLQICKDMICAFQNLQRSNGHVEIMPFEKGALFTAATLLSRAQ
ncbi:negative regulator of systemic acquired resistance (SNI1) [Tasmannia lanceolata]|uniref:negative regulator of systemic acquired resistance (SNI1) n=1 Tax=Tasmannia lanceolata TaxID=3420 RepID=UPI004063431C